MFRIGEFSQIARVSGRLLRYYDSIGLLRPGAYRRDERVPVLQRRAAPTLEPHFGAEGSRTFA